MKSRQRCMRKDRTKSEKLKKEYRQTKDHNGQTRRGRKVCKFYRELDSILGHRPTLVPPVLLNTGTTKNGSSSTENPRGDSNSAEGREEIETNGNNILYIKLGYVSLMSCIHCLLINRYRWCSSNCNLGAAQMTKSLGMKQVCICQACSISRIVCMYRRCGFLSAPWN